LNNANPLGKRFRAQREHTVVKYWRIIGAGIHVRTCHYEQPPIERERGTP
jgi:hypothetical protein